MHICDAQDYFSFRVLLCAVNTFHASLKCWHSKHLLCLLQPVSPCIALQCSREAASLRSVWHNLLQVAKSSLPIMSIEYAFNPIQSVAATVLQSRCISKIHAFCKTLSLLNVGKALGLADCWQFTHRKIVLPSRERKLVDYPSGFDQRSA